MLQCDIDRYHFDQSECRRQTILLRKTNEGQNIGRRPQHHRSEIIPRLPLRVLVDRHLCIDRFQRDQ